MKPHLAVFLCLHLVTMACTQAAAADKPAGAMSAAKMGDTIVVESKGGSVTYKAVVDSKQGGNITELSLPGNGEVIAREINDLFYHGTHGEEYTLRGWTGKSKFVLSCAIDISSQTSEEVVVQVNTVSTGTFKVLTEEPVLKAQLKKTLVGYKDPAVNIKRTYTFRSDRVSMKDEVVWVYPDMALTTAYVCAGFMPRSVQEPARLVKNGVTASFYPVGSGGDKLPAGITYPFTAENFLKDGYKVSMRTTDTSFPFTNSDHFFYEKAFQQDWYRLSGFMYRPPASYTSQTITMANEIVFSKATAAEMPPIVTIQSPAWEARWMDDKGEVAPHKIGEVMQLSASAVNSDGSPVADKDISWEIHIDPWWKTPPVKLEGAHISYRLPEVTNEEDKTTSKDRKLLAVMKVIVKGKNATESVEPFTMLVGR